METKRDFIETLLRNGVKVVSVVSSPDYNGGRQNKVVFADIDPYTDLDNFEYLEYSGDVTDVVRKRNEIFLDHYEPRYEEAYDVEVTLQKLVLEKLMD